MQENTFYNINSLAGTDITAVYMDDMVIILITLITLITITLITLITLIGEWFHCNEQHLLERVARFPLRRRERKYFCLQPDRRFG